MYFLGTIAIVSLFLCIVLNLIMGAISESEKNNSSSDNSSKKKLKSKRKKLQIKLSNYGDNDLSFERKVSDKPE